MWSGFGLTGTLPCTRIGVASLYGEYSFQGLCLAERDIRLHCTPDCQIEEGRMGGGAW